MVTPGRLLLGLSHAQAAGAYVVNLRPTPLADDSAEHRAGQKLDGAFDVFAPLAGGVEVPFTLGAESGGVVWRLELRAPLSAPSVNRTSTPPASGAKTSKAPSSFWPAR